jgi:hypothetical protein
MKYFYLYVFILICFIFYVSYFNTFINRYKETFNSNKQTFVFLGDSIFKNDAYVKHGTNFSNLIEERTNGKSICLAIDHSKIIDIYSQFQKIPKNIDNNFTTIFLSVGGNDILTHYVDQENDSTDTSVLQTFFIQYQKLIESIRNYLTNVNIVLLDIYYPNNIKYKKFHFIINQWNKMIYNYANNNNYSVFKISNILTKPEDFSFGIEPSSIGSKKLVDTILSSY